MRNGGWFPYLQADGAVSLESVEALSNILVAAFDDPDRQGTARRTILSIRQGNEDFSSFYAQFQDHVPYARMDDGALLAAMTEAISPKIRQAMITVFPAPATLAAYVEMARQIDARQRAENERRSGTTTSTTSTTIGRSRTAPPPPRAPYTAPATATTTATGTAPGRSRPAPPAPRTQPATTTTATGTAPGPIDLSRQGGRQYVQLSAAERQRRIEGRLCFHCGKAGHQSSVCRSRANAGPGPHRVAAITTPAHNPQEESSTTAAAARDLIDLSEN